MRRLSLLLLIAQPLYAIIEDGSIRLYDREPVSLRGYWNFSAPGISRKLRVDKEWRLQGIENVATAKYSLKIFVPAHLRQADFGLMLPPVSAAIKIRFNGFLVAEKGVVSDIYRFPVDSSEAFAWYPVKREFLVASEAQELELEITGFRGGGGVYGNAHLYFGGIAEIRNKFNQIFLVTAVLAAAILMIALFHFALVPDRSHRRANLHYVLLSFSMACHILGINGIGYYLINDFLFNAALIHLIIAAFPFAMNGFSLRYFRLNYPVIRKMSYGYAGTMVCILVACVIFPSLIPFYLRYCLPAGVIAMSVALAFAIFASIRGIASGVEGAKIVFIGFIIYAATVLNDILFYFSYAISIKIADAGFLVAVICIAVALAIRLQRAAQEKEELREWKKEISLAAHIQYQALSQRTLRTRHLQITTLFRPMKIIGGDFFAFHEISETETGVFIADVSGHGIAAALTVSTLRTVFHQLREYARSPAQFLTCMNRALYPLLYEQFVTAAYCVFDFTATCLRLAQAGHPPVYLLKKGEPVYDKIKPKGKFFGLEPEQTYEEAELDLSRYRRVFLYSDGVIEAGALRGVPYSVTRLENLLARTCDAQQQELLQLLDHDIKEKTGTDMNTEDDSSCVVADVLAVA